MKSLAYRRTKYTDNAEVTTFYVFGMPVYKRVIIDMTDSRHRPVGFKVFPTDAPSRIVDDEDDDAE